MSEHDESGSTDGSDGDIDKGDGDEIAERLCSQVCPQAFFLSAA